MNFNDVFHNLALRQVHLDPLFANRVLILIKFIYCEKAIKFLKKINPLSFELSNVNTTEWKIF